MFFLLVLVIILLLIIVLLEIFPLKIAFAGNLQRLSDLKIIVSWLNPMIKGIISNTCGEMLLTVYFFNNKILTRQLSGKMKNRINVKGINKDINLVKEIRPVYTRMNTSYGFEDPSITGMVCGFIYVVSEYLNIDSLCNKPDFCSDVSYFNISGVMQFNVISSLIRFFKYNRKFSDASLASR